MCGRYTLHATTEALEAAFETIPMGFREERRYNIAPGQWVIVIRPDGAKRRADVAFWGLIPGWVKDPNAFSKPINARAETLEEKASFRTAFKRKRCLIPASGFYEWKAVGKSKQPFYIRAKDGGLFAFAGLMEDWQGSNGEIMVSACIVTTEPNALMAGIHNRMPVILPKDDWGLWLDPSAQTREVKPLLRPYPDELMAAHPVSAEVGNVRNDHPGLIEPISA